VLRYDEVEIPELKPGQVFVRVHAIGLNPRDWYLPDGHLRLIFEFLGVTDSIFITAGGTGALNHGQDRDAFLAPHLQAVQAHAQVSKGEQS
jgi:hypothetical protein